MSRRSQTLHRVAGIAGALLAALGLSAPPANAREVVDPAAVRRATSQHEVIERAERIDALARRRAVDRLGEELRHVLGDAALGAIAREWLLDRGLHELALLVPTPSVRALVTDLARRRPEVFVRIDPEQAPDGIPLYDPGATARFLLQTWTRTAERDAAVAAVQAGLAWPVERFAARTKPAQTDAVRSGILEAFAMLTPAKLARYRSAVLAALERGERVDEIGLLMAVRLRDPELHRLVLDYAEPMVALAAVRQARDALDDATALATLIGATRRAEIASAALLEIGRIAQHDSSAREHLFVAIHDPAVGSPAALAAQIRDTQSGQVVYEASWQPSSPTARAHTVVMNRALVPGRNYRLWLAFNKPMRVRDAGGAVVPYRGQATGAAVGTVTLEIPAFNGQDVALGANATWLNSPGGAPSGYLRYSDDAFALDFTLPGTINVTAATPSVLALTVLDLAQGALDSNPATAVDWGDGHWLRYENVIGAEGDDGGLDCSFKPFIAAQADAAPPATTVNCRAATPAPPPPAPPPPASGGGGGGGSMQFATLLLLSLLLAAPRGLHRQVARRPSR